MSNRSIEFLKDIFLINIKARSQSQGFALPARVESPGSVAHSAIVDSVVKFKNWKWVEGSQSTKYYISWEIKSLEVKIPLQTP